MQKLIVSLYTQVTKLLAYLITYKYTRPETPAHVRRPAACSLSSTEPAITQGAFMDILFIIILSGTFACAVKNVEQVFRQQIIYSQINRPSYRSSSAGGAATPLAPTFLPPCQTELLMHRVDDVRHLVAAVCNCRVCQEEDFHDILIQDQFDWSTRTDMMVLSKDLDIFLQDNIHLLSH